MTKEDLDYFEMMFKLYFIVIPLIIGMIALIILVIDIKRHIKTFKLFQKIQIKWNEDQLGTNKSVAEWMEIQMKVNCDVETDTREIDMRITRELHNVK